ANCTRNLLKISVTVLQALFRVVLSLSGIQILESYSVSHLRHRTAERTVDTVVTLLKLLAKTELITAQCHRWHFGLPTKVIQVRTNPMHSNFDEFSFHYNSHRDNIWVITAIDPGALPKVYLGSHNM